MIMANVLSDPAVFSEALFEKMKQINRGIAGMELYEFRYCLNNLAPKTGWDSIVLDRQADIEDRIKSSSFFTGIQLKPKVDDRIVLDENIVRLTNMLFVGLVTGQYTVDWVRALFYFDIRGFYFLVRTVYFTDTILAHFGGQPLFRFEEKQRQLELCQDVGYKEFKEANAEVDRAFIDSVKKLIAVKETPILLAIAGPTAAGKTEIVERLRCMFEQAGKTVTSIEMDNFLTDRDYREEKGIGTLGQASIHFGLLKQCLADLRQGRSAVTPRYDFIFATSSHDLDGNLKPGCTPIAIEPAEIIFIEGNFPFLLEEIAPLIGIKVVYLTDDAVRLKRKWKRDIDYRKKYEPTYLRNRFFKDQFLMAQKCYRPQLEKCDILVDTTGAAIWVTPKIARILTST